MSWWITASHRGRRSCTRITPPTRYQNLIGRVEHRAQLGALLTDFNLIKPGALHRANGGYLILDARKVLTQPYAWDGLKCVLQAGEIRIELIGQMLSLISTISLEPEAIPLHVKVALFGDRILYYLLWQLDPDFAELFKVEVDFEEQMDRNGENQQLYARLISTLANREGLLPLDRSAVACVIERSARMMGDAEKLSIRVRGITDLLREANYWADESGNGAITAADVQQAPSDSPWRKALRAEHVRALVFLPLIADGELIGSLNLGMREPGQLTSGRMEIAHELATQLAIGIRQARLREQVQRHADELEARVRWRTAALQASQARLQAIFDNAPVGIAQVDLQGRVIDSNPELRKMLGYSAEELEGMHFAEFTHPADVEPDEGLFQELLAGERQSYGLAKRYVRKDGNHLWVNLYASFVRDAQGEPQFGVGLVEDVTEQREAQEALIQAEKLAITGRLAASLAHEINNPMQSVIGCLALAQESLDRGDEEDLRELLGVAAEELDRAAGTVSDLRDLNEPSKPRDREPADVNLYLEQVLTLTKKQCQRHEVEVEWCPAEDLPTLMLVPDRMNQVFLNLVLNAVDAMPDGGRLRVSTGRADDPAWVRITLADTGRGIAPAALPHVFDPFYTTKSEGLGLGLYITRNIVDEHGGRIEVESLLGEGTTFTVWLPVPEGAGQGGR